MRIALTSLRTNTFLRHNAIFFVGSLAVGALNYVYYPILGRLLEPAAFGEVQTLISLFLQLVTFLMVLSIVTVNVVTNTADTVRRNLIVVELEKVALLGAIGLLFVVFVFGEQLRQFLNFESQWPFVLLAAALVVTVPFTSRTAYLRGAERFASTSVANMLGAGGKVLLSALLVLAGFGSTGAIAGLVLAQAAALGYATWQARRSGFAYPAALKKMAWPKLGALSDELRYSFFVFLGSLGVTILFSIDVLIAKRFFDANTAGLYAGVATVARIIFFLTASVAQVLMPAVKLEQPAIANRKLFIKSALLLAAAGGPIWVVCAVFPALVVSLLMGPTYTTYAALLPSLSTAIFVLSLLNLLVIYFLALRQRAPAIIVVVGAVGTTTALAIFHADLGMVVTILLGGASITCASVMLWAFFCRAR